MTWHVNKHGHLCGHSSLHGALGHGNTEWWITEFELGARVAYAIDEADIGEQTFWNLTYTFDSTFWETQGDHDHQQWKQFLGG